MRALPVAAMLALLLAGEAGAAGAVTKKKKKAAETAAVDAAIKKALDAEQQHIADCVLEGAPPGAWAVTVRATVKVTSAGQVMSADVSFDPAKPESTRACVEKVLRGIAYPTSPAPLISISREWAFAMK